METRTPEGTEITEDTIQRLFEHMDLMTLNLQAALNISRHWRWRMSTIERHTRDQFSMRNPELSLSSCIRIFYPNPPLTISRTRQRPSTQYAVLQCDDDIQRNKSLDIRRQGSTDFLPTKEALLFVKTQVLCQLMGSWWKGFVPCVSARMSITLPFGPTI